MVSRSVGSYPIPGATMPTWLIRFDDSGQCVSPGTANALVQYLAASRYSDVIFHSHGWNTDFSDALDQYGRFLRAFQDVIARFPVPDFKPIFVGVTWPSVWLAKDAGPVMAAVPDETSVAAASLVDRIAWPMNKPDKIRFYALTDAATLDQGAALELARLITPQLGGYFEDSDGRAGIAPTPDEIVEIAMRFSPAATGGPLAGGAKTAIGPDGMPVATIVGFADRIDPRNLLRLFSLYQMKDRAGTVGANGIADLLRKMLAATDTRVQVCGHSFGAKVMLSALCAPAPLPRTIASLLLLQPAISHLAMADEVPGQGVPGGYRRVLDLVAGPILTTFSELDQPLHDVFHLALRRGADLGEARISAAGEPPNQYAALGGYGPRHSGERLLNPIPEPGTAYMDFGTSRLIGLDGSSGRITSHGDVTNGYTAWALRRLIAGA